MLCRFSFEHGLNGLISGGYNWHEAYYLYPIGVTDMCTASPDRSLENTNLYQNTNWPTSAGGHAEK